MQQGVIDMAIRRGFKVYVDVSVMFIEGEMLPKSLIWEDGTRYEFDKVEKIGRRANKRAGGCGICYLCRANGKNMHLYYEENNRWFVESKK